MPLESDKSQSSISKAWMFVFIQFILLGFIIFLSNDVGPSFDGNRPIGLAIEIIGAMGIIVSALSIRSTLTPLPIPKSGARLSTRGLYKYVRHPMYTSVLILCLGFVVSTGNWIKAILLILLYALFYSKTRYEEKQLKLRFSEYETYAKNTPRLIPFTKL